MIDSRYPKDWKIYPFGELVENFDNVRKPLKKAERSLRSGIYPYYGASRIIDYIDDYLFEGEYLLIGEDGANLVARSTPIAFKASGKFWVNNHAHIVQAKPKVLLDYLMRYFNVLDLTPFITGTAQPKLTKSRLKTIPIPLPPLPEQRRIAAILDKADELRAKRRAALDKLDTLLRSIFLDMFGDPVTNPKGWRRIKFDKLLTSIDSGWSPRCEKRAAEGDEWGVLKLGAVTTCRYIESENKALPLNLQPKEQLEVKAGDLLFSRKNTAQLVAACALVMTTPAKLMLSDLIFRFRLAPNAPICPEYLWGLLTDQRKRREIQSLATGAAGSMPNISKKRLREIPIELPPYEMQAKFAEALAKCEHLRQLQAHKSQKQDNLFHALQQQAFRGELTGDKA